MTKHRFSAGACAALAMSAALAQTPTAQQIADRVTANDLRADVSFLASDAMQGRGTPSPFLDIAAEFVAAQFRRAGLEPAGDDGYFQTAPFVEVTPVTDGLELTVETGGQTIRADNTRLMAAPLRGGSLQAAGAATAALAVTVDLSRAGALTADRFTSLETLAPEQVRGKVLVLGPRDQAVRQADLERLEPALVIQLFEPGRASQPAFIVRGPGLPLSEPARRIPTLLVRDEAIYKALMKPGPLDATISAHIPAPTITPVKLRNVVGILRGSDPTLKDTYILLTAHYDHLGVRGTGEGDHIFNGANDDASGTASVIEIANTLAALPSRPKRSIVFVGLFGEELGLRGSRYYAQHPVFPLDKTVADINLEELGRTDDNTGPRVGVLNATGYDFTTMTGVFKQAGGEFGIQVVKDEKNSDPFFSRSDNQAFADAGVPSHTLSVGYVFPDYHQAGDEWPKLDYENMAKVDRTIALGIFTIADSAEAPQWNASNPKTARYVKARESAAQPTRN